MEGIKANWPILFEPQVIEWHFEKLMGQNLCNIDKMFELKKKKLIEFGVSKKFIETKVGNLGIDQELLLVLQTISKYFEKNINILINQWTTVSFFLIYLSHMAMMVFLMCLQKEDVSSLQTSAPCIVILTEGNYYLCATIR